MAWVYCLSHVPALLLLDGPAFEDRNARSGRVRRRGGPRGAGGGIVAQYDVSRPCVWEWAGGRVLRARRRARVDDAVSAVGGARALALATAIAGWAGVFVLGTMRRERGNERSACAGALGRIALRPDALVFAAPVFFHVVRAGLTW